MWWLQYCGDIFIVENESAQGSLTKPLISPAIGLVVGLGLFPDQAGITAAGLPDLIQAAKAAWDDSQTFYATFPFDLTHTDGSIVHCEVNCAVHPTPPHRRPQYANTAVLRLTDALFPIHTAGRLCEGWTL